MRKLLQDALIIIFTAVFANEYLFTDSMILQLSLHLCDLS